MKFEDTQPYKLGMAYRQFANLLLNPKTSLTELAEFGQKMGFQIGVEIINGESGSDNEDVEHED